MLIFPQAVVLMGGSLAPEPVCVTGNVTIQQAEEAGNPSTGWINSQCRFLLRPPVTFASRDTCYNTTHWLFISSYNITREFTPHTYCLCCNTHQVTVTSYLMHMCSHWPTALIVVIQHLHDSNYVTVSRKLS